MPRYRCDQTSRLRAFGHQARKHFGWQRFQTQTLWFWICKKVRSSTDWHMRFWTVYGTWDNRTKDLLHRFCKRRHLQSGCRVVYDVLRATTLQRSLLGTRLFFQKNGVRASQIHAAASHNSTLLQKGSDRRRRSWSDAKNDVNWKETDYRASFVTPILKGWKYAYTKSKSRKLKKTSSVTAY